MRAHRRAAGLALTALLTTGLVGVAPGAAIAKPDLFPTVMDLPDGWMPEGITIRRSEATAWLGSRRDGSVYELDLRTGKGRIISDGPGTPAVGLKSDRGKRLFVAGGDSGTARVVDIESGETLRTYRLAKGTSFVNDVILTRRAAWFTDSLKPQLYRLPIGPRHRLPDASKVETLPLTGEWVQGAGFAANGITRTPDHRALLVVHSTLGQLFRVNRNTGAATAVEVDRLDDRLLTNGDGLLLKRRKGKVFVVQNRFNRIALVKLNQAGTEGTLMRHITSEHFDVPTTVDRLGSRLYLPNARFGTEPQDEIPYTVVKVSPRRS
jgi:sugar lactone lactonase YvrE